MTSARDDILAAVRGHLGRTQAQAVPPPPPVPVLGRVDAGTADRVREFGARLEAVGGRLHMGTHDAGASAVAGLLQALQPRSIATSDAPAVLALRQHPALAAQPWLSPTAGREALFAADVGVTGAQWAIAETGTLALDGSCERHRLASLLPPVHIALLPASRLLADLGEVMKTLTRPLAPAITLVTGPSRTADIELELVVGVHGPGELHVVLV